MLQRIGPRSLVIVPGDRADVIGAIVGARRDGSDGGERGARARPDRRLSAGRARSSTRSARADLFATLVPEDTYQVASELHDLLVKTHPADAGKIAEIKALRLGVPVHRPGPRGRRRRRARLSGRAGARRGDPAASGRSRAAAMTRVPTARRRRRTRTARDPERAGDGAADDRPDDRRQPDAAENRPWAVPLSRPAPRREDRHAADEDAGEPEPSSGAIATSSDRIRGQRRQQARRANAIDPTTTQPLGAEPASRPREGVHVRHLDGGPDRPGDADQAGAAAERHDLDRVERGRRRRAPPRRR